MKEFKGTPAPWEISEDNNDQIRWKEIGNCKIEYRYNANPRVIEQVEADTALISAALDLLEALKDSDDLLKYLLMGIPDGKISDTVKNCISINQAAINKALSLNN